MPKLNARQQRFVNAYLVTPNASKAALEAGYSAKTAYSQGNRLLKNVEVRAVLEAAQQKAADQAEVNAARVFREMSHAAFSDVGELLNLTGTEPKLRPFREVPEGTRRAISSLKVRRYVEGHGDEARTVEVIEFRLWNKLDALEKLGRQLGLFKGLPPLEAVLADMEARGEADFARHLRRVLVEGAEPESAGERS